MVLLCFLLKLILVRLTLLTWIPAPLEGVEGLSPLGLYQEDPQVLGQGGLGADPRDT